MAKATLLPASKRTTQRKESAFKGEGHVLSTGKATATNHDTKQRKSNAANNHTKRTNTHAIMKISAGVTKPDPKAKHNARAFRGTIGRGQTLGGEVVGRVTRSQTAELNQFSNEWKEEIAARQNVTTVGDVGEEGEDEEMDDDDAEYIDDELEATVDPEDEAKIVRQRLREAWEEKYKQGSGM